MKNLDKIKIDFQQRTFIFQNGFETTYVDLDCKVGEIREMLAKAIEKSPHLHLMDIAAYYNEDGIYAQDEGDLYIFDESKLCVYTFFADEIKTQINQFQRPGMCHFVFQYETPNVETIIKENDNVFAFLFYDSVFYKGCGFDDESRNKILVDLLKLKCQQKIQEHLDELEKLRLIEFMLDKHEDSSVLAKGQIKLLRN